MGAEEFRNEKSAKTATEAFRALVEEAKHEHGHGGYTGTIAEKAEFRMLLPRGGETPLACMNRCADDAGHWSSDKWGPAACIDGGEDPKQPGHRIFYFFGYASS